MEWIKCSEKLPEDFVDVVMVSQKMDILTHTIKMKNTWL